MFDVHLREVPGIVAALRAEKTDRFMKTGPIPPRDSIA